MSQPAIIPGGRRVIVDTREQRPYDIPDSKLIMLPSGDYSLEGLEDQVAIERKSEDDLIQSLVQRWPRFRAELERLQGYSFAAVVMETSIDRILAKSYTRSKIAPRALLGLIAGAMINHHPVHWYFAGDRIGGYHLTCELLKLMGERF